MIVDDYIAACEKYIEKYGNHTACLFQIGDFFEMNAYYEDNILKGADIYTICDICNIQVTRKNKTVTETSRSNPLMAGFPIAALSKFTALLLAANYTIVVVRQVTPPPNVIREVTEILSPSTLIVPNSSDANYLLCIYFDEFNAPGNYHKLMSVGIAGIDISTGSSFVYEAYSSLSDPHGAYDEVYRIIDSYGPKEIVVLCDHKNKQIVNSIETNSQIMVHYNKVGDATKHTFQNIILNKSYGNDYIHIGLEYHELAKIALVSVLQFAYEHNENIIKKLQKPQLIQQSRILTLQYNSATQLQVVSSNSGSANFSASANSNNHNGSYEKPLLHILNRCATSFGRRLFKERLLTPIHDKTILESRYDEIDYMLQDSKYIAIHRLLQKIGDIERMCRRMCLGKFPPIDWNTLNDSLSTTIDIFNITKNTNTNTNANTNANAFTNVNIIDKIKNLQSAYNVLDLSEASKYLINDIKGTVFKTGYNSEIDNYNNKVTEALNKIRRFEDTINQYDQCTIDCSERDGYFINITKRRWETVKSRTKNICGYDVSTFNCKPISSTSNVLRLTHIAIDEASTQIIDSQKILSKITTDTYIDFLNTFYTENNTDLLYIANLLASIDITSTCAKNAHEYNYVRPTLVENTTGSYIYAKEVRHPIIERIHTDIAYIANDVALGNIPESRLDTDMNSNVKSKIGLLLYGSNSSGKSSYMKSIGLNIIMAQSGMYAAASQIEIAPYKSLFTRIQGNDNVYKRMSTFIVEMTELRNIFQRCNEYSLVLGDELCSGTESVSATSIVAAGTYNLLERKTTFIFATHLHELIEIPIIKDHKLLNISHIHVDISPNGVFIYDRKLRDGSGSSIYGVEVCESLGMPDDFVKMAQSVRKHILEITPIASKKSVYNSQVYVDKCTICNESACEVHHIKYQCTGIDNNIYNLVPLCKKCHNEEHNGYLAIEGYIMTSEGRKLKYSYNSLPKSPKSFNSHESNSFADMSIKSIETHESYKLTNEEINEIKSYIKYSVAGWFIKKTPKGKWQLSSANNVLVFISSKFVKIKINEITKNNEDFIDILKTHLLVV